MLIAGMLAMSLASVGSAGDTVCAGESHGPSATRVVAMSVRPSQFQVLSASPGGVRVDLVIDADGTARDISAVESSLPDAVSRAAEHAVGQWDFSAARECGNGVARAVTVVVPMVASRGAGGTSQQLRVPGPHQGADFGRVRPIMQSGTDAI